MKIIQKIRIGNIVPALAAGTMFLGEEQIIGEYVAPAIDYSTQYFTIESLENSNFITFYKGFNAPANTFYYSLDDGSTWDMYYDTMSWTLDIGEKVMFKATADNWNDWGGDWWRFSSSDRYNVYGNIMSLLYGDNFIGENTLYFDYAFANLFDGSEYLVDASNLILPATTLANYCYGWIFGGCSSLIAAPELPATTLAQGCYRYMFYDCTSLTTAPELPATTLTNECYNSMFTDCNNLNYIKCLATDISALGSIDYWVYDVAASGTFVKDASMNDWELGESGIPFGWTVEDNVINYEEEYFTINSLEDNNTISFIKNTDAPDNTFYCSLDGGSTWDMWDDTMSWTLDSGDKVMFKATVNSWHNGTNQWHFDASGAYKVYGNIMSLIYGDNFDGHTTLSYDNTFRSLFYQSANLIDASNLILPATTLAEYCYKYMFSGTSLTTAPELPATTLGYGCYESMFYDCTSLTTAPELHATTLADYCYYNMFKHCTALTTAPALPATTLTSNCYRAMFQECSSLTTAPALPATTLTTQCYRYMFYKCTSLNSITCLATNISASSCLTSWVSNVAASGTFYKNSSMSSWGTGANGIPSGWTVQDAA